MWDRCWTFLVTQQCLPELQPFWSRKELKSTVLMQQQLQNLYLTETRVSLTPVPRPPRLTVHRVLLTPRGRRVLQDDAGRPPCLCQDLHKPSQGGHEDTLLDWPDHVI